MDEDERRHFQLAERHRKLEAAIQDEQRRPLPDSVVIARLKREKLLVKEQLSRIAA